MLRFRGAEHFRQRLVLSTLTGRPIRIDGIRADAQSPGLQEHEASLLRLIEKLTNGCIVEINETGRLVLGCFSLCVVAGGVREKGAGERLGGCPLDPLIRRGPCIITF